MQLAHLLPHLDAEIERLQKARDLLALSSSSTGILHAFDTVPAVQAQLASDKAVRKQASKPAAVNSIVIAPEVDTLKPTIAVRTPIKARRAHVAGNELGTSRRKPLILPDTALRGMVPAGPVVVSAAEVRKSQASKTAQAKRAAEVKQAGAELTSSFNWRSRTTDAINVDSLLQRLMSIGESTEQGRAAQLPSLGPNESLQAAAHTTASSKLD